MPQEEIKRLRHGFDNIVSGIKLLAVTTIVLVVALILGGVKIYHDAGTTNKALCALRTDLNKRVAVSQGFLKEHPNGTPGISRVVIQTSIANQSSTIEALSILSCDGPL